MTASSTAELSDRPQATQSFRLAAGCFGAVTAAGYGTSVATVGGLTAVLAVVVVGLALSVFGFRFASADRAVRLGRSSRRYLLLLPGVILLVVGVVGVVGGRDTGWVSVLLGAVVCFFGWTLASMARTRHVRRVRASSSSPVTWEMSLPARVKRRRYGTGVAVLLLGFVALVVGYVLEQRIPVAVFGGIGGGIIGSAHQTVTLHAHERGLEIQRALTRGLIRWESFDGYRLTADTLRLRRSWRPDIRCERDEIDDIEAVTGVLARHLDGS